MPVGLYSAGDTVGFSLGFVPSLSWGAARAELSAELVANPVASGSMLGARAGWVFGAGNRLTFPVLLGWRFADIDNDCREGCDRVMTHTVGLDAGVGIRLGSAGELRLTLTYENRFRSLQ